MQPIRTFNVSPSLPPQLEPLRKLAYNLHWDWNVETKDLFQRLDRDLWESSRHNPVLMLGTISQARLTEVAEDEGFLAQMERASRQLDDYLKERTWYRKQRGLVSGQSVAPTSVSLGGSSKTEEQPTTANGQRLTGECYAYFCAEFGLVDCLPIYSGGLGVLAITLNLHQTWVCLSLPSAYFTKKATLLSTSTLMVGSRNATQSMIFTICRSI
jgi:starch phosphorylase